MPKVSVSKSILYTVFCFLIITVPGWISSVWSLFYSEPFAVVLSRNMGGFEIRVPHWFSPYWITIPIGVAMFAVLIRELRGPVARPLPNLRCRRIIQGTLIRGRRSFATGYRAVFVEIGNDLSTEKLVAPVRNLRASIKYKTAAGSVLQIVCPGLWSTDEWDMDIPVGESARLCLCVVDGYKWFTSLGGELLEECKAIELEIIDPRGASMAAMNFTCAVGVVGFPAIEIVY